MTAAVQLVRALLVTELVECVVAAVWFRSLRRLQPILLCNLLTNPLMNALLLFISSLSVGAGVYYDCVAFLEISVVASEAVLLRLMLEMEKGKAYLLSLLLNGTSYFVGILLYLVGIL